MLKNSRKFCLLVLVLAVSLCVACNSGGPEVSGEQPDVTGKLKDYNLVFINIDSLRADHLGCYGYRRNTSPFIDSLAEKGMKFERALSNSAYTRESVSVLLSGRLPSSGACTGWYATPSRQVKNMGELFKEAGYKTAFFANTNMLKDPDFTVGFDEIQHLEKWGVSGNGPKLSRRAGEFMKKCANGKGKGKFMLYLHYLDPHGPYEPPDKYYLRFAKKKHPKPLSLYKYVRKKCTKLIKQGFGPGRPRFEDLVLRYDAEIAFIDDSIRMLLDSLKEHNLADNTLVILTADHGEELLDHQFVEHAWTLYNESIHIPLIFHAPGAVKAKVVREMVSTVDLLPTLLDIMEIPHGRKDFDGVSLFQYNEGGTAAAFTPPEGPFIAELQIQHRNLLRTVVKGHWKYIAARRWLPPAERPKALHNIKEFEMDESRHLDIWGPVVHEELYDLSADPKETRNLAAGETKHEKHRHLKALLGRYSVHCRKKGLKPTGIKKDQKQLSEEEKKKLKSLGYL